MCGSRAVAVVAAAVVVVVVVVAEGERGGRWGAMSRNMLACLAGRQSCGRAGPDHSSLANQPQLSPASTLAPHASPDCG